MGSAGKRSSARERERPHQYHQQNQQQQNQQQQQLQLQQQEAAFAPLQPGILMMGDGELRTAGCVLRETLILVCASREPVSFRSCNLEHQKSTQPVSLFTHLLYDCDPNLGAKPTLGAEPTFWTEPTFEASLIGSAPQVHHVRVCVCPLVQK